jgi:FkbM family methyltransferase
LKLFLRARRIRRRGDPEIAQLAVLIGTGRRTIDIGANRGVYSYWLAQTSRMVEAFEPNPVLAGNLARAGIGNITVHALALSECSGPGTLLVPCHRNGGFDDPGGRLEGLARSQVGQRFAVTLARLDDFAFDDVDFIKIDVEGHEEKVILGGWDTIVAYRPFLLVELEERHNSGCVVRVRERFEGLDYRLAFLDDGIWHPADSLGAAQFSPSGRYINNFLLCPNERFAALGDPVRISR